MQVGHINYHITTMKHKNFKMINLLYMVSILNSVFTIVLYVTRWTKQDLIYIFFEEFSNELNLLHI
jgi:hypothetical protein